MTFETESLIVIVKKAYAGPERACFIAAFPTNSQNPWPKRIIWKSGAKKTEVINWPVYIPTKTFQKFNCGYFSPNNFVMITGIKPVKAEVKVNKGLKPKEDGLTIKPSTSATAPTKKPLTGPKK